MGLLLLLLSTLSLPVMSRWLLHAAIPVPRPGTCRHRLTRPSELPHPVKLEQAGRERRQATNKMRITVFYDNR